MVKLNMQTTDVVDENIKRIGEMFPNCLTEVKDEKGRPQVAIDFDQLRQELSKNIVEGPEERYQFTWPDKRNAIRLANAPTTDTLRPCREESVDFDNTQNLYIEGDNLQVLKLLRENYLGKVKMIYIDPPYNTGNDFVYNDNFDQDKQEYVHNSGQYDEQGNQLVTNTESNGRFHTDWLNMIYPRLKVAKDLLSEDGVIFISIDDNEEDNLQKTCNEILGESNFMAKIIHKNNSMKNQSKYVGITTEYVLLYSKNIDCLKRLENEWRIRKKGTGDVKRMFASLKEKGLTIDEIREEIMSMYSRPKYSHLGRWNKVDDDGVFTDKDLSRANGYKDFTIVNPATGKECLIPSRGWGKNKDELEKLQRENMIWYGDDRTPPREKSYLSDDADSVFDNYIYIDTSIDKKMLDELFGCQVFEYPKPVEMINIFLQLCTKKDSIILDFFSGSATTAHAVMQLNAEDGGKRKFIMVQLPEATDEKSEAYKAGYKNICEIGKERIRRAGKKIKEESPLTTQDLDTGFRVLKLDSSNMQDVYYTPEEFDQRDLFEDNIKSDRTEEDLLFQTMIDLGIELSAKIEQTQIAGKTVWNVSDGYLMACFDEAVNETTITEIAKQQPYYFVMRDKSLANDNVADNFEQIFNHYSKDTIRRIL
jgi:adenine-specific DNA-methyltransferase